MQIKEQQQRYRQQQLLTKKRPGRGRRKRLGRLGDRESREARRRGGLPPAERRRAGRHEAQERHLRHANETATGAGRGIEELRRPVGAGQPDARRRDRRCDLSSDPPAGREDDAAVSFGDDRNDDTPTVYDAGKIKSLITAGTARQNQDCATPRGHCVRPPGSIKPGRSTGPRTMKTVDPTYRIEDHPWKIRTSR